MSTIIKQFKAQDDRMPTEPTLVVSGIVTVDNTAIQPSLVLSDQPAVGTTLNLDLKLDLADGDIGLTVINDKEVRYTQASGADITIVNILENGVLLTSLEVLVTH